VDSCCPDGFYDVSGDDSASSSEAGSSPLSVPGATLIVESVSTVAAPPLSPPRSRPSSGVVAADAAQAELISSSLQTVQELITIAESLHPTPVLASVSLPASPEPAPPPPTIPSLVVVETFTTQLFREHPPSTPVSLFLRNLCSWPEARSFVHSEVTGWIHAPPEAYTGPRSTVVRYNFSLKRLECDDGSSESEYVWIKHPASPFSIQDRLYLQSLTRHLAAPHFFYFQVRDPV
jgi:hypothetical protein